mmetsp:Transcript_109261/g.189584  ORF Transcript_109261/g.189584 Transcript_109261/m.189584 type:complete len:358 (+) Transcript_109261:62-1135(+)
MPLPWAKLPAEYHPRSEQVLDGECERPRQDLGAPRPQHWKPPCQPVEGVVLEVSTVNQYADALHPLILEFEAPESTCGFMSMANSMILLEHMPEVGVWNPAQVHQLTALLRDTRRVQAKLREAMTSVRASRATWIDSHVSDFPDEAARRDYFTENVKNHEISDFLQGKRASEGSAWQRVHFLRQNHWPFRHNCKNEEYDRLCEEQRFGGVVESDVDCRVRYDEGDSVCIVESFYPDRRLQTMQEFVEAWSPSERPPTSSSIFVLDINGHFVTAVAAHVEDALGMARPTIILFNTTVWFHHERLGPTEVYDLVYAPLPLDVSLAQGYEASAPSVAPSPFLGAGLSPGSWQARLDSIFD